MTSLLVLLPKARGRRGSLSAGGRGKGQRHTWSTCSEQAGSNLKKTTALKWCVCVCACTTGLPPTACHHWGKRKRRRRKVQRKAKGTGTFHRHKVKSKNIKNSCLFCSFLSTLQRPAPLYMHIMYECFGLCFTFCIFLWPRCSSKKNKHRYVPSCEAAWRQQKCPVNVCKGWSGILLLNKWKHFCPGDGKVFHRNKVTLYWLRWYSSFMFLLSVALQVWRERGKKIESKRKG